MIALATIVFVLATTDPSVFIAAISAVGFLIGGVVAWRKLRGEKVDSIVRRQSTLLTDMTSLYEIAERTIAALRSDAVSSDAELAAARVLVGKLQLRVTELVEVIEARERANGIRP